MYFSRTLHQYGGYINYNGQMKKLIWFLFSFQFFTVFCQNSIVLSGPMLGYNEMREVLVWIQFNQPVTVKMKYWEIGSNDTLVTPYMVAEHEKANIIKFIAKPLNPGTTYSYTFKIKNSNQLFEVNQFTTQPLWQHRTQPPTFSFTLGSCTYINDLPFDRPGKPYGGDYFIFESIAAEKPNFMLWLGDNTYLREADFNTTAGILHRYTHTRKTPELQNLLKTCHHYAIWDDHDFGPNDADGSYFYKHETLKAFQLFWGNNGYGINQEPSAISRFTYGDVDFFLLDNRFFRTPEFQHLPKQILGQAQIDWLISSLKFSKASFKMVAVGGQFLNAAKVFENHSVFEEERQQLIELIEKENIKGVVFLTGDRHHTELSKLALQNKSAIFDLTVSPLTSSATKVNKEENELRVPNTKVHQRNYGLIEVSGEIPNRQLKITIKDNAGNQIWNYVILQSDF